MHYRKVSFALLFAIFLAAPAIAEKELAGVKVPESRTVESTTLTLNGVGLRLATMLKVKVYVMALYLESPSNDAAVIITSQDAARIELHMLRDVDAKDMRKAWEEGFEKNYQGDADLSAELDALKAATGDLKEGDVLVFDFNGDKVLVSSNNIPTATIQGAEFRRALMSVWLGDKPPNKEVKAGALGLQ